jgi:hypothetical protein
MALKNRITSYPGRTPCVLLQCALIFMGVSLCRDPLAAQDRGLTARIEALEAKLKAQEARLRSLEDIEKINKLTRAYGYYVDKNLWDHVVDMFADDCSVEIAQRGVYLGKKGADRLFRMVMGGGKIGLAEGRLFNHFQLQGIVDIDAGGRTAKGRWRAFVQISQFGKMAIWSEGIYENDYVKEAGIWKFKKMKFWATYYTPYEDGWAKNNLPNNGPSKEFPPDLPPTDNADVFPRLNVVPPFHYKNPVSGR